jgi:hypothetical protein
MKKIAPIIIAVILLSIFSFPAYSYRGSPPEVKPVSKDGIKYSRHGEDSILAIDEKTGDKIWIRQIYVVKYMPELERDVQNCFIIKIEHKDNKLIIENEKNYKYELNLNTLEVKVLKGSIVVDITKDLK